MKHKCIGLIIIWNLIIILFVTNSVKATVSTINLEVTSEGNSGDTITVMVKVTGSSDGVSGIQGTINFDADVLEYQSYTVVKDGWFISGFNQSTGVFLAEVIDILDEDSYIYEDEVELFYFTFVVKDSAEATDTSITLQDTVISGAEETDKTDTVETVAINGGSSSTSSIAANVTSSLSSTEDSEDSTNSSNSTNTTNSTSNSSSSSTASSNSTTNSQNSSTASNSIPETGKNEKTLHIIFILCIIGLATGISYYRYKDI